MKKSFKNKPSYWVLRLFFALPDRFLYAFAHALAAIAWFMRTDMRRITELNIKHCYPSLSAREQKQLAKASVLETFKNGIETFNLFFESRDTSLNKIKAVHGLEHIEPFIENGNGVVIIMPHIGNWEYLGYELGRRFDMMFMFKPHKHPLVTELITESRAKTQGQLVPTAKSGVMAVLKHIKKGGVTGILPDQVPKEENARCFGLFFGHSTPTMTLSSNLIRKPNVKAVAAMAKRVENGGFNIHYLPVDEAIYSKDNNVSLTALNKAVEDCIALAPAQYQWEYKRFKFNELGKKNKLYKSS